MFIPAKSDRRPSASAAAPRRACRSDAGNSSRCRNRIPASKRHARSRKQTLVDYGFRLPSAMDNRPLNFEEFESHIDQMMFVSATPSAYVVTSTLLCFAVSRLISPIRSSICPSTGRTSTSGSSKPVGVFDVLVGINLLREGLDIPQISLVAILDADKEGFLRSATSLIQTIGRAARNAEGHVAGFPGGGWSRSTRSAWIP